MLPKWFLKWNDENPTNIYGPAILFGAVGGAVVVSAMLVVWGQPFAVEAAQTGPAGTGMSVTKFVTTANRPDPTLEGYTSSAPVVPQPGDQLAGDAYPDAEPLLAGLTVANYDRLVEAMRTWTGIPTLFDGEETYQTEVARQMIQMTQSLNSDWEAHTNSSGAGGVNCYTCHRGEPVPSDVWYRIAPVVDAMAGWSANQNFVTIQSQYTSLPSDALEKFLLETNTIVVHSLESRVAEHPSDPEVATWQDTERTFSLMNYISNSLGVNCVFCHNSRAFYSLQGENTPQWALAQLGIGMVQELNNEWLVPVGELLPPERLGPVYADAPKAACATCHKGYQKPMGGVNMIADWPELASADAPSYE